jgi:hypothetical protein
MIRVKNLRPCVLIIPDARLRLAPGETAELDKPSSQVEQAIARGQLSLIGEAPPSVTAAEPEEANLEETKAEEQKPKAAKKSDDKEALLEGLRKKTEEKHGGG